MEYNTCFPGEELIFWSKNNLNVFLLIIEELNEACLFNDYFTALCTV